VQASLKFILLDRYMEVEPTTRTTTKKQIVKSRKHQRHLQSPVDRDRPTTELCAGREAVGVLIDSLPWLLGGRFSLPIGAVK
jgi:hypothetical protein